MIGDVPDDFDLENFQRTLKAGRQGNRWIFELPRNRFFLELQLCFDVFSYAKKWLQVRLGGEPEVCVNCPLGLKIATRS